MAVAISSSETSTIAQAPELIIATPCSSGTRTAIPSAKAVHAAPKIPGQQTQCYSYDRAGGSCSKRDRERNPRTVEQPAENVATQMVCAEQKAWVAAGGPARRPQPIS